jgi:hypothetical protein
MNTNRPELLRAAVGLAHTGALICRLALLSVGMLTAGALPATAQDGAATDSSTMADNPSAPRPTERARFRPVEISYFHPHDARSLNQFEAPKQEGAAYDGFKLSLGAAFTQQFQALRHSNSATPSTPANTLIPIGSGFNNADANLYLDAQIARGIRVALTSYLSSRHHPETWVKEGYLLVDASPWEQEALDNLFRYLTLRVGHFEINYGDMHFRRTDNGQALFNPLVGNLLMDAFTTEIGGEVYVRANDLLAMAAVTGGEVRGQVTKPESRSPSYMGKLGFDRQLSDDARVRLTGSVYHTTESVNNTLYSGSRAGSRYYYVVENLSATEAAQAWSGDVRPGFSNKVTAWVINPFVKFRGLELFGNVEQAEGRTATETSKRKWEHYAAEGVYRFLGNQLYVAARYNVASGRLSGMSSDVEVNRVQVGGGWFLTSNMEAKIEYVEQRYKDFPASDIRNGAKFSGTVVEAVVSF